MLHISGSKSIKSYDRYPFDPLNQHRGSISECLLIYGVVVRQRDQQVMTIFPVIFFNADNFMAFVIKDPNRQRPEC